MYRAYNKWESCVKGQMKVRKNVIRKTSVVVAAAAWLVGCW